MVNPPFSGPQNEFKIEVLEEDTPMVLEELEFQGNV